MSHRFFEFEHSETISLVCWNSGRNGGLQAEWKNEKEKNHQMKVYGKRRGCTQIGLVKRHLVWRRIREAGDIFGVVYYV